MHILVVNYSLRRVGGAEIYVLSNIDALLERGHRVTAVSADKERPTLPGDVRWIGAADFFSTSLSRYWRAVRGARQVARQIEGDPPNVALLHLFDAVPGFRLVAGLMPTIRFVHTAWPYCPAGTRYLPTSNRPCDHRVGVGCLAVDRRERCLTTLSGQRFGLKNSVRRLLDMRIQAGFMRSATLVAANSHYTEQEVRRIAGPRARVVVLPPPVRDHGSPSLGHVPGRVLFAGRLTSFKGVKDAIAVVAKVGHSHLRVAGDGPYRSELERHAERLGVGTRVTFLGWLAEDALSAELQSARVVVLPSMWPETFGQVGVQAALAGRPVVAYDTGGVREWLSEATGVLVPVGDVSALTDAVRLLLDDEGRWRELATRARPEAKRFELGPFMDRMAAAIDEAVRIRAGAGHGSRSGSIQP